MCKYMCLCICVRNDDITGMSIEYVQMNIVDINMKFTICVERNGQLYNVDAHCRRVIFISQYISGIVDY